MARRGWLGGAGAARWVLLVVAAWASVAAGQPNDLCANAMLLPLGESVAGETTGATTTDGFTSCIASGRDVWYVVNVDCPGDLTLYICPASFNTVLSLHSGCPGTTNNQIACNNDSPYCGTAYPQTSAIAGLPVAAGTYYVRVAGVSGATGTFILNAFITRPNDACGSATPIFDGITVGGCTSSATRDGSASCGTSGNSPDVWYSYTAACDGALSVATCPASFDTVISVHSGCPGTSSNQIACNDDSIWCGAAYPLTSRVEVAVQTGQTYYVRVSGYNGATGTFVLDPRLTPLAPLNDACANAAPLTNGSVQGSTRCATEDGSSGCALTGADTWYRYTPACGGTLTLTTCPVGFDSVISVHTGCPGTAANEVACNDDGPGCAGSNGASRVSVPVSAGTPYLVRVSGFIGFTGPYTLNASVSCCYANCDGSTTPPVLNVLDFNCFLNRFATGDPYANCDGSTVPPVLNVLDFNCFLNSFAVGCP